MPRIEYRVVVVDRWSATHPLSVRKMVESGLPPKVVARWQEVRRQMSPAGLKRKAKECRN